jgi:hypothetical protein
LAALAEPAGVERAEFAALAVLSGSSEWPC